MVLKNNDAIRKSLHTLFNLGAIGALTDGQLLERFADVHGEARELAFAALVERHGPFVLRICRAILGNEHDAADAFQATFLALVRKAESLWVKDSLGPWLHQAALRAARHDRAARARRNVHERAAALKSQRLASGDRRDGLEAVIHEEINRLPAGYRVAVVLCDLEGRTYEQAARHMGCAVGTVKSRLARGRERLRDRLIGRGMAPEACAVPPVAASWAQAVVAVPRALVEATIRCAMAGTAPAGEVPVVAALLALWTHWRQLMIKAFLTIAIVLTLGALGFAPGDSKTKPVAGVRLTFVDLQWIGNHKLSEQLGDLIGNNLAAVPRGPQKLGGTWFKIGERLVRVRGQPTDEAVREVPGSLRIPSLEAGDFEARPSDVRAEPGAKLPIPLLPTESATRFAIAALSQAAPGPPAAVRGIAIGARFDTLHILQSTMFGNAFGANDGTEIGTYIVYYENRTEERIPIIYGKDVRDWWRSSDPEPPSRAKVAWAGKNAAAGEVDEIRLFSSEWQNPHPDTKVMAIDFETKNTACAPFLMALTLERSVYQRHDDNGG
jgi:RNA polymerase sigma factor (sigma-70 family)